MKKEKMSAEQDLPEIESEMKERGKEIQEGRVKEKEMSQGAGTAGTKGKEASKITQRNK